jgi:hypothetical protein
MDSAPPAKVIWRALSISPTFLPETFYLPALVALQTLGKTLETPI